MNFTISASGTKEQVLEQLEHQRDDSPDYRSLKNQVLEHIAGYVQNAPEGSESFSVSVSATIEVTGAQSSAPASTEQAAPVDDDVLF